MDFKISPAVGAALPYCIAGIAIAGITLSASAAVTAAVISAVALIALNFYETTAPDNKRTFREIIYTSIDPTLVVTTANRILGDIADLNSKRGTTKFSYKTVGNREQEHDREINKEQEKDKDAAIASLHQKLAQHLQGLNVTLPPPKRENWGFKTFGDPKRTFYTFSQNIVDSNTQKVIATTVFNINHTDKSKFSFFSSTVEGILESTIEMEPFKVIT